MRRDTPSQASACQAAAASQVATTILINQLQDGSTENFSMARVFQRPAGGAAPAGSAEQVAQRQEMMTRRAVDRKSGQGSSGCSMTRSPSPSS